MDFLIFSIYSPVSLVITGDASISSHIPRLDFRDPFGVCGVVGGMPIYKRVNVKSKFIICTTFDNYMSFWGGSAGSAVPILKG